jgi:hypothetical protein
VVLHSIEHFSQHHLHAGAVPKVWSYFVSTVKEMGRVPVEDSASDGVLGAEETKPKHWTEEDLPEAAQEFIQGLVFDFSAYRFPPGLMCWVGWTVEFTRRDPHKLWENMEEAATYMAHDRERGWEAAPATSADSVSSDDLTWDEEEDPGYNLVLFRKTVAFICYGALNLLFPSSVWSYSPTASGCDGLRAWLGRASPYRLEPAVCIPALLLPVGPTLVAARREACLRVAYRVGERWAQAIAANLGHRRAIDDFHRDRLIRKYGIVRGSTRPAGVWTIGLAILESGDYPDRFKAYFARNGTVEQYREEFSLNLFDWLAGDGVFARGINEDGTRRKVCLNWVDS